jgi:hypothetical protein
MNNNILKEIPREKILSDIELKETFLFLKKIFEEVPTHPKRGELD